MKPAPLLPADKAWWWHPAASADKSWVPTPAEPVQRAPQRPPYSNAVYAADRLLCAPCRSTASSSHHESKIIAAVQRYAPIKQADVHDSGLPFVRRWGPKLYKTYPAPTWLAWSRVQLRALREDVLCRQLEEKEAKARERRLAKEQRAREKEEEKRKKRMERELERERKRKEKEANKKGGKALDDDETDGEEGEGEDADAEGEDEMHMEHAPGLDDGQQHETTQAPADTDGAQKKKKKQPAAKKKTATKKAPAAKKVAATTKKTPVKKAPAKKTPAKKPAAKKPAAKKTPAKTKAVATAKDSSPAIDTAEQQRQQQESPAMDIAEPQEPVGNTIAERLAGRKRRASAPSTSMSAQANKKKRA